jgi:predicted O-methyltransferase YrrM
MLSTKFTNAWFLDQKPVHEKFITKKEQNILEIGAFEGRSTLFFLDYLEGDNSRLDTIDPFVLNDPTCPVYSNLYDVYIRNVSQHPNYNKLILHKDFSQNVLPKMLLDTIRYDYILIDGSHISKDVILDAVLSFNLLKPGGIIFFDDYGSNYRADDPNWTSMAVNAFTNIFQNDMSIIHSGYHLVVRKN